jgi:membrane protease YdiL (CAAX protease family)
MMREAGAAEAGVDRDRTFGWVVVVAAMALLLVRPAFAFGAAGVWLLTATYAVLLLASVGDLRLGSRSAGRAPEGRLLTFGAVVLGAGAILLAVWGQQTVPATTGSLSLGLTALASVAEEAFFRGFLYRRLAPHGAVVAIVAGAAAFALVHALAYPPPAVGVDFAAGLLLGWQRWAAGTWLVPAGTHMFANLLVVMA